MVGSSLGAAAIAEAATHAGKPYRYGATGPGSFDCSGFVQYLYGQRGISLPRTSAQQAAAARSVPRGSEQLGDLIIFRSGGAVTHLGIYAGNGTMWVARRTGTTVTRQAQAIYTSTYSVGRVAAADRRDGIPGHVTPSRPAAQPRNPPSKIFGEFTGC